MKRRCSRCRQKVADSGDWYSGLCPECADATDGQWECKRCGRSGDFEAMGGDGQTDPDCCSLPCVQQKD